MAVVDITEVQGISTTSPTLLTGNNLSIQVTSYTSTEAVFTSYANNMAVDTLVGYNIFHKNLVSGVITLVDKTEVGVQANNVSLLPVISPSGGKVMFTSAATNLATLDGNGVLDVFVKDINSGQLLTVSTNAAGQLGNNNTFGNQFTPDGGKVLLTSYASNFVSGDTNNMADVFLKDLTTGAVSRLSTSSTGTQANNESFLGAAPTILPNSGIGGNFISADGSKVVFSSLASNLITGDTNNRYDVFVKDTITGATTRVSTGTAGTQGNQHSHSAVISHDGTQVAFISTATNLGGYTESSGHITFDVFVKSLVTGELKLISKKVNGAPGDGDSAGVNFSYDGSKLVFSTTSALVAEDTNLFSDIYVANIATGELQLISKNLTTGALFDNHSYNPSFSADGRSIVFETSATNHGLVDFNGAISDVIKYSIEAPCIFGGDTANNWSGTAAAECYHGEGGNDTILGGGGDDTLRGDADNDSIDGGDQSDVLFGGMGDDTLLSGSGNNTVYGDQGNDSILGGTGANSLDGGIGNDFIQAGSGSSTLIGDAGYDTLIGGDGNDTIDAGGFNDTVQGGNGSDSIFGSGGNDSIDGGGDWDSINGGTGNDTIDGGEGFDYILGHSGADVIFGGVGSDSIYGQNDNDLINGEVGDDLIDGGAGDDTITGGIGVDTMTGGAGVDTFVFLSVDDSTAQGWVARDTIKDFQTGVDKLDLSAFAGTLTFLGMEGSFTGAGNEVYAHKVLEPGVQHTMVVLDVDGDRVADLMFNLRGNISVVDSDFIL